MPDIDDQKADPKKAKKKPDHPRDPAREVVETVVFVVVLVLLLKLFVTEAFVIPTGSMAETLYGYQRIIPCPKCGHEFPVNAHDEVEGRDGRRTPLSGFICPNCRHDGSVREVQDYPGQANSGDRVLVLKPLYHLRNPRRGDVVVFKFPEKPQEKQTAQNYIKRAMLFGGETGAIFLGDLYVTSSLTYPEDDPLYPRPRNPLDLWQPRYMYSTAHDSNPRALELFDHSRNASFPPGKGGFEITRKHEDHLLADCRIVWDNNKQPDEFIQVARSAGLKDRDGQPVIWWPRWYAPPGSGGKWTTNDVAKPVVFEHADPEQHWLRYRHLVWTPAKDVDGRPARDETGRERLEAWTWPGSSGLPVPGPVDNFLGYNAGREGGQLRERDQNGQDRLWVSDLILECETEIGDGAEVVLELSKGVNRFRAVFASGKVTLSRTGPGGPEFGTPSRQTKATAGKHKLRFANVDCRLWVWVDGKLVDFGTEGDYQPPSPADEAAFQDTESDQNGQEVPRTERDASGKVVPKLGVSPEGWTRANDILAPASIGARGRVTVRGIKLLRDVYYTRWLGAFLDHTRSDHNKPDLYYVQPGHSFCLGDNSAQSSDSRKWGVVPDRLMLGKAVFVFFPIDRAGFIK